ncbi:uncharacterized protein SETTUDRAFT_36200 [Exserohilum turcica Et28A]|uniref:Uncharacterized protein n=1 Tax=Exserohilum turcicum (strain 28A) TaxID=671987 RepID=R0J1R6_EXST2|nr:uncharacterized protein SETTUDRAFT_36200 [Exserohilum turcica Et28A]EOA90691.1 hypothetical protein SETTUDRAFT_36200 [Exserohilum turcica Et28A]
MAARQWPVCCTTLPRTLRCLENRDCSRCVCLAPTQPIPPRAELEPPAAQPASRDASAPSPLAPRPQIFKPRAPRPPPIVRIQVLGLYAYHWPSGRLGIFDTHVHAVRCFSLTLAACCEVEEGLRRRWRRRWRQGWRQWATTALVACNTHTAPVPGSRAAVVRAKVKSPVGRLFPAPRNKAAHGQAAQQTSASSAAFVAATWATAMTS